MATEPETKPVQTPADAPTVDETTPAQKLPPVGPSGRERFADTGEWLNFG